jgi:16S rRNA (cytosine967-C5)-methyltransferase
MIKDPRHIALNILRLCKKNHQTLDQSLDAHHKEIAALSKRDRNLCNAITFGVLRQRENLDFYIRTFSKIEFKKLDFKICNLLRIGLYQRIYMDRIPVSAAVNTCVSIAKMLFNKKVSGFVNAVLRNACDNYRKVSLPDEKKDPLHFLSITHSIPLWIAKRWIKDYGFDKTKSLCKKINTPPPITIRVNTMKTDRQTLSGLLEDDTRDIALTNICDTGISFSSPVCPINELKTFESGLFQIQDEAAQIVSLILDPKPGEVILDACAGLGGKTNHIAQLMEDKGSVFAMDFDQRKLDLLSFETKRLVIRTSITDFPTYFDRVLLDAPCSGLGVLRRNPDTKWKRSRNDVQRLAGQQKKMLNAAANLTAPGGVLVFAVCSCEKEENENIIESFLNKRKDFSIDRSSVKIIKDFSRFYTKEGFFKTYPNADDMDGFFAARLKREPKEQ